MLRQNLDGCIDLLGLHLSQPQRYPFFLESQAAQARTARFDIAFGFPGDAIEFRADGLGAPDFFESLATAWTAVAQSAQTELPFIGGWFFLLGYEAARALEPALKLPGSPFALPDAVAVRCPAAVIVDRLRQQTILIAEDEPDQITQMRADCKAAAAPASVQARTASLSEEPAERFIACVERSLDYLQAGDIFQVNPSRLWQGQLGASTNYASVYQGLRRHNPAPFGAVMRWQGHAILSSSPERLIEVDHGVARTRPIAGTRRRSGSARADQALKETLLANPKERAEHLMLIDLERNDLGRIAVPGTTRVTQHMAIESYAHVHHIVSEISARLKPGLVALDALKAVFPGGTITGCPKIRAMQIIAELEGVGRGPYYGSMGYWSRCGRMDSNILIRTIVCQGQRLSFRTGAGIVADSDPVSELAETRAKAKGLLMALGADGARFPES